MKLLSKDKNVLIEKAYLIITFDDGNVEIFNRNYGLISKDITLVPDILNHKKQVETWRSFPSPCDRRRGGDAKWYE